MKLARRGKRIGLLLALSSLPALTAMAASQPEDIQQLLVQGHYWVGQGHPDLAIAAWEKVLLTDPDNAEAKNALRELKDFHPSLIDQTKLALARKLARQHKYADALKMYKLAFAGGTPNSFYAAEYYETLSGTRGGWKTAVKALSELVRKYPSNPYYRLVHARVLTYHESTRRDGIATLEQMAGDDSLDREIRARADEAWKNALLWLPGISKDRALYERYLARHADDAEIRDRLANLDRIGKHNTLQQAWDLLEKGEAEKADIIFSRLLRNAPDNADIHAGLGVARMKLQRFSSAAEHLEKALTLAPEEHPELQPLLEEAQFWARYKAAEQAMKRGRYREALKRLDEAAQRRPDSFEVLLLRAAIEARRGNIRTASNLYDEALQRRPDSRDARRGLLQLLIQSGDEAAALRLLRKHHLSETEFRKARNRIRAERLRQQARLADDRRSAIIDLRKALELTPENAWLRLELARLLTAEGQDREARDLFDGYLHSFPGDDEAHFAAAIFHAENGRQAEALAQMEAIPAAHKSEAQLLFEQRLRARLQLEKAKQLIAAGDYRAARLVAEKLQQDADDPVVALIHAELLARIGEEKDALWRARNAWKSVQDDTGAALQYATVLLLTHQYQALDQLLMALKHRPGLTPADESALARLRLGLELELADNLRKSGDYNAAWRQLLPFLPAQANHSTLRTLLASIYHDAGNDEMALRLYQEEVAHHPDNRDAWSGAAGAAMALGDNALAASLIEQGLEHNPDDPVLLVQRAQLDYLRGRRQSALADLDNALAQAETVPRSIRQRLAEQFPIPEAAATPVAIDDNAPWAREALALKQRIAAETATTLTVGTALRQRSGTAGLDELTTVALPLEWRSALNADMHWGLRLTPTLLDAGAASAANAHLLGSEATGVPAASDDLSDEGVQVSLFYEGRQWNADIGVSGAGLLRNNVEGRIAWKQQDFDNQLIVAAERRTLRETLLSWAGLKDGQTGIEWGGVSRNAISIDHYLRSHDAAPASIHGHISYAQLDGEHVEDNDQLRLEGSIHWSLSDKPALRSQLGVRLAYQHFDKNLRGFTLGQGGYFSPQHHLALTFPVDISGRRGALSYGASLSLGLQYFTEDDSLRFPLDDDLTSQLEAAGKPTLLEGNSRGSFTAGIRAGFEYRLGERIGIGGVLASSNDNDYNETGVALFLRYYFDRATGLADTPRWEQDGKFSGLW